VTQGVQPAPKRANRWPHGEQQCDTTVAQARQRGQQSDDHGAKSPGRPTRATRGNNRRHSEQPRCKDGPKRHRWHPLSQKADQSHKAATGTRAAPEVQTGQSRPHTDAPGSRRVTRSTRVTDSTRANEGHSGHKGYKGPTRVKSRRGQGARRASAWQQARTRVNAGIQDGNKGHEV